MFTDNLGMSREAASDLAARAGMNVKGISCSECRDALTDIGRAIFSPCGSG